MNATELMIGNLIEWYEPNSIKPLHVEVTGVSHNRIEAIVNGVAIRKHETHQSWKPIKLTEKIMLSIMGYESFVNYEDEVFYDIEGLILYSTKKGFRSANDFAFVDEERLEYVHQLQNLYFVVMGKKLIIKTKLHGKQ